MLESFIHLLKGSDFVVKQILCFDCIIQWIVKSYDSILRFLVLLDYENEFYKKLLSNIWLEDKEKEYLFKIHTSNLSYEYKQIVNRTISFVRKHSDIYDFYEKYLYETYDRVLLQNMLASEYQMEESDGKKKEIIMREYGDEIRAALHNFALFNELAKNIDSTFHTYNVWTK